MVACRCSGFGLQSVQSGSAMPVQPQWAVWEAGKCRALNWLYAGFVFALEPMCDAGQISSMYLTALFCEQTMACAFCFGPLILQGPRVKTEPSRRGWWCLMRNTGTGAIISFRQCCLLCAKSRKGVSVDGLAVVILFCIETEIGTITGIEPWEAQMPDWFLKLINPWLHLLC